MHALRMDHAAIALHMLYSWGKIQQGMDVSPLLACTMCAARGIGSTCIGRIMVTVVLGTKTPMVHT